MSGGSYQSPKLYGVLGHRTHPLLDGQEPVGGILGMVQAAEDRVWLHLQLIEGEVAEFVLCA